MTLELKVPSAGESVTEVRIGAWLKEEGDHVEKDETIVELDSDKAALEVPAPISGILTKILLQVGDDAAPGDVLAYIDDETGESDGKQKKEKPARGESNDEHVETETDDEYVRDDEEATLTEAEASKGSQSKKPPQKKAEEQAPQEEKAEAGEEPTKAKPKEPTKERDSEPARSGADEPAKSGADEPAKSGADEPAKSGADEPAKSGADEAARSGDDEEIVPMTMLRRRIAENLVKATQQMALLTTVNEIDMSMVAALRKRHKERFQESYGTGLGFMSFFVKSVIEGLKHFPPINAEIRGTDIVYRNRYDIGIAIGSKRGLVVPVLRQADRLSFAEIELAIRDFADRAERNKLRPDELARGTFSITNGGVYGSLLSTPIINPPQSAILGMHSIVDRPIAVNGEVVIRPMMYVALTYDHRIVDGREAVLFLRKVKDLIEDPARMLLEI